MTEPIQQLTSITATLVSPVLDYSAVLNAVAALKNLFYTATGFNEEDQSNWHPIQTEGGVAIDTLSAAFCITDMMRTKVFLSGLKEAIEERLTQQPGKPVTLFYAGTGPFATLVTPLTTLFSPAQLQLVLLEINKNSLAYLQQTIQQFALAPHIIDVVEADATTYILPPHHQPDILVCETMKPALAKEPQVSIVSHLLPQCNRQPILIPEKIDISVALVSGMAETGYTIKHLQTLLTFSADTAARFATHTNALPVSSTGIAVTLSHRPDISFTRLQLLTSIHVFSNHSLGFNECGLTIPVRVADMDTINTWPVSFIFQYNTGSAPGFIISRK